MPQTYKSDGIILKRWEYKEQDRMLRILTRSFGKVTVRAISARKAGSKLAGHIEPFIYADFFFATSRTIDILAGSVVIDSFSSLRHSLRALSMASLFVEVVDSFTQERDADLPLFEHVRAYLVWLNASVGSPQLLVLYSALLKLFSVLGYHIELYHCHQCKQPIAYAPAKFVYQLWAVECQSCVSSPSGGGVDTLLLSPETIKVLRFLHERPYADVSKLRLSAVQWRDVDEAVRSILHYHHDGPLKSESVLLLMLREGVSR